MFLPDELKIESPYEASVLVLALQAFEKSSRANGLNGGADMAQAMLDRFTAAKEAGEIGRFEPISSLEAREGGLMRDCVHFLEDKEGRTWACHERAGLRWRADGRAEGR